MVARVRSTRPRHSNGQIKMNVRGRPIGSTDEFKHVARATARREGSGRTPDEMLREWADTGVMFYPSRKGKARRGVELCPADRISCAKGSAQFYKAPMKVAEETRPIVVTIDENMLAAVLSSGQPKMLEAMRDMLADLQAGKLTKNSGSAADPSVYAQSLKMSSPTAGRA